MKSKIYLFLQLILLNLSIVCCSVSSSPSSSIVPVHLRTESLFEPWSLPTSQPRFSWRLAPANGFEHAKNLTQSAYQVQVFRSGLSPSNESSTANIGILWDSGVVHSRESAHIRYEGIPLRSGQVASWRVRVWDQQGDGNVSSVSEFAHFGVGLLHQSKDWKARWVYGSEEIKNQSSYINDLDKEDQLVIQKHPGLKRPLYFRKTFHLDKIETAVAEPFRLFVTTKGVYQAFINGVRLGTAHLNPGWTDYHKSIQYQSFAPNEVEKALKLGENVITIAVGPGWHSGYVGYSGVFDLYGTELGLLFQLDQGNRTLVKSDRTWSVSNDGPLMFSDLLQGETYYHRNSQEEDISQNTWHSVKMESELNPNVTLIGEMSEPIIVTQRLKPKWIKQTKPGVFLLDFGQNFAGVCSLKLSDGQIPTRIQLRHGEILTDPFMNGTTLYTANLKTARATDVFFLRHQLKRNFIYRPSFTYHGFRFVELTVSPVGSFLPTIDSITGEVMQSGFEMLSHFRTSSELVNQLASNIHWTMRSNLMSIPTDCPQRDERLGWSGDAHIFAPSALYQADLHSFYRKWLHDLRDSQSSNGALGDSAPRYADYDGSPGWVDALVRLPHALYQAYGDLEVIKENYEPMVRFIEYVRSVNPEGLWRRHADHIFGDWLELNGEKRTNQTLVATVQYARDVALLAEMASAIGRVEEGKQYQQLFRNISQAFQREFVNMTTGSVAGETQAGYVFALAFDLLPEGVRPLAAKRLAENIIAHERHLTTGIMSVGLISSVLSEHGYNDLAYELLLQQSYPSWLYPIVHGQATTVWERWDGWTEAKGLQDQFMNSFNHYALGSVAHWMYSQMAGITSDLGSGYRSIRIRPRPGLGLTQLSAIYRSIRGDIKSEWSVEQAQNQTRFRVSIPVNTEASLVLPGCTGSLKVGSGDWEFVCLGHF